MTYSIEMFITNNTSYGLSPNDPATATAHGYYTGGPNYAGANTTGVSAGKLVAAQSTWTGCDGISVYVSPDPAKLIILLGEMPYVGHNNCKVAVKPAGTDINGSLVNSIFDDSSITTSATFDTKVDGVTKKFALSGTIEQGTQVSATFTLDVTN